MKPMGNEDRRRLILALVLLGLTAVSLVALWASGYLSVMARSMVEAFRGKEEFRAYVESWGAWAPVAFIALQALQVVFAPIPGELTGAVGGFIFGAWTNVLYSSIGLTVGSIFAFAGGRLIGLPLVKLVVSDESLERFHFLTERSGTLLSLVLFTFPGFPKDILCYLLGLSPMGFWVFLLVCAVGRLPGTIMLSFSGSAVYEENWTLVIALSVVCAVAMGVTYLYRERLNNWMAKRHAADNSGKEGVSPSPQESEGASAGK